MFSDACDSTVGQTHWDVYAPSSSGFAAQPASFAVPPPRCQTRFNASASTTGNVDYALLDLTGDGTPELVVLSDSCDATVGSSHWDVYASNSTGLAAQPTPFAIPAARCQTHFDASASATANAAYALLDLTGDRRPDLVVFSDTCDATVGNSHWDVYAAGSKTGTFPGTPPGDPPANIICLQQ